MLRKLITALVLAASPAAAQDLAISNSIAENGLAATEASLTGDAPETAFARGAVRFLIGIEKTLQLRYRHNAHLEHFDIPVLRLPLPDNPDAQPFYPGMITELFGGLEADMNAARAALADLDGSTDFGLAIDITGLWFDVNANATRDAGEGVFEVAGATLGLRPGEIDPSALPDSLIVRFDTADAAWLRAYTHLISGIAELVVAFDPTDVITEVLGSVAAMNDLRGQRPPARRSFLRGEEQMIDMFAMVYGALNRRPDPDHTNAARNHLLAMIAENRAFWQLVTQETDNAQEWLPNASQTSAFGFELPPETRKVWLAVLADAEAVLTGDKLVGHWRIEPGAGINVARLLQDPPVFDIVTWVHGYGLLDYMERGPLADESNLMQFERMFSGDAALFMVWLN
ncbi:MAG: hypothetical protein GY717_16460 [Rhodobacteraceae bacterium]|nr:hypothetical protein [Paracoccaceae bacterium]